MERDENKNLGFFAFDSFFFLFWIYVGLVCLVLFLVCYVTLYS